MQVFAKRKPIHRNTPKFNSIEIKILSLTYWHNIKLDGFIYILLLRHNLIVVSLGSE